MPATVALLRVTESRKGLPTPVGEVGRPADHNVDIFALGTPAYIDPLALYDHGRLMTAD
jgi:hypothetical protein